MFLCVVVFSFAKLKTSTILGSFLEATIDQPKDAESGEVPVVVVPSSSEGNSATTSVKKKNKKRPDLNNTVERDDGSLADILKLGRTGLGSGAFFVCALPFFIWARRTDDNKS